MEPADGRWWLDSYGRPGPPARDSGRTTHRTRSACRGARLETAPVAYYTRSRRSASTAAAAPPPRARTPADVRGQVAAQQLDGVLPVVPGRGAELVQDPALLLAARPLIPHAHRRRIVVPGLSLHLTGPPFGQIFSKPVGQICSEATTPPWVRSVSMQVVSTGSMPRCNLR